MLDADLGYLHNSQRWLRKRRAPIKRACSAPDESRDSSTISGHDPDAICEQGSRHVAFEAEVCGYEHARTLGHRGARQSMKIGPSIVVLTVLAACYIAAGSPAIGLLFKPSIIGDALALKPITYHWANRADRAIPEAELLASRFYVLILAVVSVGLPSSRSVRMQPVVVSPSSFPGPSCCSLVGPEQFVLPGKRVHAADGVAVLKLSKATRIRA